MKFFALSFHHRGRCARQRFQEKQWIREIQPRAESQDDTGDQADEDAGQVAAPDDEDNIFEVRIDGGIWEDWERNNGNDNMPAAALDNDPMPLDPVSYTHL